MTILRAKPTVSVAVVTYDQCGLLRECLDSILAQDYPHLEVVIADDASPDRTRDVIADLVFGIKR